MESEMQVGSKGVTPLLTSSVPVTRTRREKPGSVEVTTAQAKVLQFIREYKKTNGFAASRPEMTQALNLASPGNAHRYLQRLERRGWLTVAKGIDRGVHLAREGVPLYEPEDFRTTTVQVRDRDESAREPDWIDCDALWELCGGIPDLCLRVRGNAMERAGITEGGIVAIKLVSNAEAIADGAVVAARAENDVVLRRYRRVSEAKAKLLPETRSAKHQTFFITGESNSAEIIGVVNGRMLTGGG